MSLVHLVIMTTNIHGGKTVKMRQAQSHHMRSNNGVLLKWVQAADQKPVYNLEWPNHYPS